MARQKENEWRIEVMELRGDGHIVTTQTAEYPEINLKDDMYGKYCLYSVRLYPVTRLVKVNVVKNEFNPLVKDE